MKFHLGKKAMEIPIHWVIIFAVLLLICLIIIGSVYSKAAGGDGLIARMFGSFGR
ncbi:hypothetical protein KY362_03315 [Candidatus Woesearchaeota archaeon]|nr:hypothetical protein [Candidatus Woesearchaeota archaeon]